MVIVEVSVKTSPSDEYYFGEEWSITPLKESTGVYAITRTFDNRREVFYLDVTTMEIEHFTTISGKIVARTVESVMELTMKRSE